MSKELPIIRTSDRSFFRRCRRRWGWSSPLRDNLEPIQGGVGPNPNLWLGTAVHFALEDYHGYNVFGSPVKALEQFPDAWRSMKLDLPENLDELMHLGTSMMRYYKVWEKQFGGEYKTWIHEGKPQVEITFAVEAVTADGKPFIYKGRFDRVVEDPYKSLWVMDFKTAKQHPNTMYLNIDSQAAAYAWAASQLFGERFEGVVFCHLLKEIPKEPTWHEGFVSVNKSHKTTGILYKLALKQAFPNGDVPDKNVEFLNDLVEKEHFQGDRLVRMTEVKKTPEALLVEEGKIKAEAADMLNPDLPLYPNPMWTCAWDCPFLNPCLEMNDGEDISDIIEGEFSRRPDRPEAWFNEEGATWLTQN